MPASSLSATPNQRASVAAYWSTEVLGSSRPWPTCHWSSGAAVLPTLTGGGVP
jgi:hypothetical protein